MANRPTFAGWRNRWEELATYRGGHVPDAQTRIDQLVELWHEPIPGHWQRGLHADNRDPHRRYRRGDIRRPTSPERQLEHDLLAPDPTVIRSTCLGRPLVDGVNAVPLVTNADRGTDAHVQADLLLLTGDPNSGYGLMLAEAKWQANNAWYAAVENLRQLRLLQQSVAHQKLFHVRRPGLRLPYPLPITSIVLAPLSFYHRPRPARERRRPSAPATAPHTRHLRRRPTPHRLGPRHAVHHRPS